MHNVASRAIAEKLSKGLFVIGNLVFFDKRDEIRRRVAGERGLAKVLVLGEEVRGGGVKVRKVAASAARDQDFASWLGVRFENSYSLAALSRYRCAEKPGRSGPQNQDVIFRVQKLTLLHL